MASYMNGELIEEQMNINQPETTMLYGTKLR